MSDAGYVIDSREVAALFWHVFETLVMVWGLLLAGMFLGYGWDNTSSILFIAKTIVTLPLWYWGVKQVVHR